MNEDLGKDHVVSGEAYDSMNWYILQAYSNCEKKVVSFLSERVERMGYSSCFGEVVVPEEDVVEILPGGKKRVAKRKLFPGYVFVQMMMSDELWNLVSKTPKVLGFVGGAPGKPVAMKQAEVDDMLRRVSEVGEAPRMKVSFVPGELVRVIDGPFKEFTGAVEEVLAAKSMLKVSVTIFGRSTPVDLLFTQVEKA